MARKGEPEKPGETVRKRMAQHFSSREEADN
jgi:hypothetical protein